MLSRFSLHHAPQHAMHVSYSRSEDVDSCGIDILLRFRRICQAFREIRSSLMYFRAGSDVADFSLDQDIGINGLEGLDCLFGLVDILLERLRGSIEDDGIETGLSGFDGLPERVSVVRVQKD